MAKTTRSTSNLITERKCDLLRIALSKTLTNEVDKIVDKYDLLAQSFHRSLEDANKKLEITTQQLQSLMAGQQQNDSPVSNANVPAHVGNVASVQSLEKPVSFLKTSFSDIKYEDVVGNFAFNQSLPGNRACGYYGDVGYTYGSISHDAAQYPAAHANPILDKIFDEISLVDPTFTRQNFSCLATLYKDGNSSIAMHSDDEQMIAPGSNIYTVSFGSKRTARYHNIVGALQTEHHELEHGSVNVMTHSSQSVWKHGIIPDSNVTTGRISLTFRHMVASPPVAPTVKHNTVPRIQQPVPPTRILLLTDSIHSSVPEHIFEAIPNHVCIKKKEYQLANIDSYKHEFGYTDIVILSMGINDLSRYNHTGETLFRTVAPMLKQYHRQFPHCKFMFNSVLLTRDYKWLNTEIEFFNNCMFDLSRHHSNLSFFDSDRFASMVCKDSPGIDPYAQGPRSGQSDNGIHISLHLRRAISSEMVKSVGYLSRADGPRFRRCDWLRNVSSRVAHS
ncbi:MAG: alpha-ketoglutarate-dependent dioxygenase AlkB [Planctomycetes bacterium]|nr:alpha-ketoglutarate-dependent dioxygenase AlkB [Planctomycetota bacterium]